MNRSPDKEVAQLIDTTALCQALHCLPGPGGLFSQDAELVLGMASVLSAQAEQQQKESDEATRKAQSASRR